MRFTTNNVVLSDVVGDDEVLCLCFCLLLAVCTQGIRRYLNYSERGIFKVFRPVVATRCTDGGKFGVAVDSFKPNFTPSVHGWRHIPCAIFGRPFVKRFALCYQTVVCLSFCLSVLSLTLLYCGQTVGWIKMKLGMLVGLGPGPHCVRWGPSFHSPIGAQPQFSAHVCCGQTAGWINMPLGTEVDLGLGDIVLDGDPALPQKRGREQPPPHFGPCIVAKQLHGSRCHFVRG